MSTHQLQSEKRDVPDKDPFVRALVLPHHDILLDKFDRFYQVVPVSERPTIRRVYLLSPNHFYPDDTTIIMKENDQMLQSLGVVLLPKRFDGEHGVNLHLPFIEKYFPNASVTPLLFTRHILKDRIDALLPFLTEQANDPSVIFIVSTDFSHDLSYSEAETKDKETRQLIFENKSDAIFKLRDDNTDCPACLYLTMKLMQSHQPSEIFHGNSAQYLKLGPHEPTTSYFVFAW